MRRRVVLQLVLAATACGGGVPVARTPQPEPEPAPANPAPVQPPEPRAELPASTVPPGGLRPDERGEAPKRGPNVPRSADYLDRRFGGPEVRVALGVTHERTPVGGVGTWRVVAPGDATFGFRPSRGGRYAVEQQGDRLRIASGDGDATPWRRGPIEMEAVTPMAFVAYKGHAYSGRLRFVSTDTGVLVVNALPMEQYLRGVVPGEIGVRQPNERAAVEAQAIAARSYAAIKLGGRSAHPYDLLATVIDQVYGGRDAHQPLTDSAVLATQGIVLTYAGRVINAPYHASAGGITAEAPEVWRTAGEPFLRRVSEQIPGSARFYDDIAPRFSWTVRFSAAELERLADRWLPQYAGAPTGGLGGVRAVEVTGRTPSGRAAGLAFDTPRGRFTVRGNDLRFVLRSTNGELLNSTLVDLESAPGPGGALSSLVVRGKGYGHGVGMCQWGAIGRARAGQDVRTILATYYPGTRLERLPER